MKRQRWLTKKRGGGHPGCGPQGGRPPSLGNLSGLQEMAPPGPKSPLSQLVAEGYPQQVQQSTAHQPYGLEKPTSRTGSSAASMPNLPPPPSGGGFDAAIAGQWNQNVQNDVMSRQNRHDPAVSGPPKQHGGQRISQPSGGNANIDLSWGGPQQQPAAPSHPPRMPASAGSGGSGSSGGHYGAQQAMNYGGQPAYSGQATPQLSNYGGQRSNSGRGPSPNPAERRGGSCPFGREENPGGRAMGQQAAPFGVDSQPAGMLRSGSRGGRGASPSPHQYQQGIGAAPVDMAAGGAHRGRGGACRQIGGGQSSVVFG